MLGNLIRKVPAVWQLAGTLILTTATTHFSKKRSMSCSRVSRVSKLTTKSVVVGGCSFASSIFYMPRPEPDTHISQ